MTFEEWWKDSEKSVYWCNNPDIRSLCKCIAQSAWEAAQPKWTYCKDGMPTEDGNYMWLDNDRHVHIDHYWADMPLMPYVIAWMSLPEAPNVHDD